MSYEFIDNHVPTKGDDYGGGISGLIVNDRVMDLGMKRPYIDEKGRRCVDLLTGKTTPVLNEKGKPVLNAAGNPLRQPERRKMFQAELMANGMYDPVWNATSLRIDEWREMDRAVLEEVRQELRAWSDLSSRSPYPGFNAYAKKVLEWETMDDVGHAVVDMYGEGDSITDRNEFQAEGVPLPITHSGFRVFRRELAISRAGGTPFDVSGPQQCARRVAETIEKTLTGTETGLAYGTDARYSNAPRVWGYTNYTDRVTSVSLTTPTGSNPDATVADVLEMRQALYDLNFRGPFMLYCSPDWAEYLDNDYFVLTTSGATAPSQTLRERIKALPDVEDVRQLDYMPTTNPFTMVMAQLDGRYVQAVNGVSPTTIQWESRGGEQIDFRVWCIMVPRFRSTKSGKTPVLHAYAA